MKIKQAEVYLKAALEMMRSGDDCGLDYDKLKEVCDAVERLHVATLIKVAREVSA